MKKTIFIFLFILSLSCFAQDVNLSNQNVTLANSYFRKGEYKKAISLFKPLHENNLVRRDYFKMLLTSYQQLEYYMLADDLLQEQIQLFPNQTYLNVEIGYNYQLQNQLGKAKNYYEKSLNFIRKNPNYGFVIGHTFKQNHLLDYALQSYQIAKNLNPKLNTEISEAQIYGEKGELDKMFNAYLNLLDKNEKYYPTIQRYIATFITEDKNNKSNILFKNLLLKRAQSNPKDSWNILLSWLFMQQLDFEKAFVQEKSLYSRNLKSLDRIMEIGVITFENMQFETSKNIFGYILNKNKDNQYDKKTELQSKLYLVQIDKQLAKNDSALKKVNEEFLNLLEQYGNINQSIGLRLAYADFLAFNFDQAQKAIDLLNESLPLTNSRLQKGNVQIKMADILVYTSQFNQALILYTQVQTEMKNSVLAQEARFKVARTSYFKGDFQWAQTQLKVLKSSTSQLIANDALDLNLLISNNIANDSIQDALKIYAKAELLAFQNKNLQAIDTLQKVLFNFKGHAIEDDALFKQSELYIHLKKYQEAERNYLKILQNYPESILIDDSYFALAELYMNFLNIPEKAKDMYQKIIFEHPSSIYLVDARKKYRNLRGDDIQ